MYGGPGDHRPRRRFLGDGLRVRVVAVDGLVEAAQELDGVEVLAAAVLVRDPLAAAPAVVEVQHRRHRVDAQPVDVVAVEPEVRVRERKLRTSLRP